ncbi:MAG: TlpA disulfide reductase family protein [Aggregatilineales bacterium]
MTNFPPPSAEPRPPEDSPPPPVSSKPSPVLLLLLIFPLLGLAAAGLMMISSAAPVIPPTVLPPTPAPVTPPPLPTPVGYNMPVIDFEAQTLDGRTVRLTDYLGRIVFLNFWATWCEPCKRELPTFEEFMAEQDDDGPIILAVNLEESAEQIRAWLRENGISEDLTYLLDPDGSIARNYGVFSIPVTYVIDEQGVVRYPKYGELSRMEIESYLTALRAN